DI
ncbi:hypothetical protein BVZ46_00223B, partial [Haemophilus influenzae]